MTFALRMFDSCQDIVEMDMKNIEHFASEVIKLADMPPRCTGLRAKQNRFQGQDWGNVDPGFCQTRTSMLFNWNCFNNHFPLFEGNP